MVFKGYPGVGNAISFQGFETHAECKHSRIARRRRQKALAEALREPYTDCRHQRRQRERRRRQGGAGALCPAERAPAPAERRRRRQRGRRRRQRGAGAGREVAGSGAGRALCCFGICYAPIIGLTWHWSLNVVVLMLWDAHACEGAANMCLGGGGGPKIFKTAKFSKCKRHRRYHAVGTMQSPGPRTPSSPKLATTSHPL